MSVFVIRALVRLRAILSNNQELAAKIEELDTHLKTHDGTIQEIITVIKRLMSPIPKRQSRLDLCSRRAERFKPKLSRTRATRFS